VGEIPPDTCLRAGKLARLPRSPSGLAAFLGDDGGDRCASGPLLLDNPASVLDTRFMTAAQNPYNTSPLAPVRRKVYPLVRNGCH
jgi:hypothetical protein